MEPEQMGYQYSVRKKFKLEQVTKLAPKGAIMESQQPDYEELFKQALVHLNAVSGSRNSFTLEMRHRMFDPDLPKVALRLPAVEQMHQEAHEFLEAHRSILEQ